ncbi:MAG TPA: hypothetical protein VN903_30275, partial [Polyangia bacterium]|nr:hypothetical protein [Polyangia bacterium]
MCSGRGGAGGVGGASGGTGGTGGNAGTAEARGGAGGGAGQAGRGGIGGSTGGSTIGGRGGTGGAGGTGGSKLFMCVPGTGGGGAIASPDGGVAACSSPLARGDFDGDGVDDCLLTVPSDALGCPSQSIFFYKGLGTSTYATTPVITPYAVPVGAQGTAIGLSGDACADLLLSTFDGPSSATSFGYVRSQCDGTFGPIPVPFGIALGSAVTYSLGYWVSGGDFTGDGRPDRVTVARTVPNARAIHWITMSDRGDPPSNGLVVRDTDSGLICGNNGSVGLSIGKGDFNNDGKLDVMATVDYRGLDVTNAYSEVIIG